MTTSCPFEKTKVQRPNSSAPEVQYGSWLRLALGDHLQSSAVTRKGGPPHKKTQY